MVSCLFVVASTLSLILSTLPVFQVRKGVRLSQVARLIQCEIPQEESGEGDEHYIFAVAEAIFVGWFTFEYAVRFLAAPFKWRFVIYLGTL